MAWFNRRSEPRRPSGDGPPLVHELEGFLSAGSSAALAVRHMRSDEAEVVYEFDLDPYYDYRARRPAIWFRGDHYADYEPPRLAITREHDLGGREFLLLSGPEPDFGWEEFVAEAIDVIDENEVSLVVGLGAIPMGVPHTRPAPITAHATKPELVDTHLKWDADVQVPGSAQALLEYRLGQRGRDAIGYVVHVPHYLSQVEYPTAALALVDAVSVRLGLSFDLEELRSMQPEMIARVEEQIAEQGGEEVLQGLEEQYDAFSRGAARNLLAAEDDLPSGDELADQLEKFLARLRDDEDRGR